MIGAGQPILRPPACGDLAHEVELGVIMGSRASHVREEDVLEHVAGYCVALDMTARDIQTQLKSKQLPWAVAKGFDTFLPVSEFIPKESIPEPQNVELWLKVDGQERQRGSAGLMIFPVRTLIAHISTIMALEPGDLVLTGTPQGVGPVEPGQTIDFGIEGVAQGQFRVEDAPASAAGAGSS